MYVRVRTDRSTEVLLCINFDEQSAFNRDCIRLSLSFSFLSRHFFSFTMKETKNEEKR